VENTIKRDGYVRLTGQNKEASKIQNKETIGTKKNGSLMVCYGRTDFTTFDWNLSNTKFVF